MGPRRALLIASGWNDLQAYDTPSIQKAGRLKGGKDYPDAVHLLTNSSSASTLFPFIAYRNHSSERHASQQMVSG